MEANDLEILINTDHWDFLIMGYTEAAECLLRRCSESWPSRFVKEPALFIYRHCLELQMKHIRVLWYRHSHDEDLLKRILKPGHNLSSLWNDCRRIINERWPSNKNQGRNNFKDYFDEVDLLLKWLQDTDSSSTYYRYPRRDFQLFERKEIIEFRKLDDELEHGFRGSDEECILHVEGHEFNLSSILNKFEGVICGLMDAPDW